MTNQTFSVKGVLLHSEEVPDIEPTPATEEVVDKIRENSEQRTLQPEESQILIKDLFTRIEKLEG